MRPPIVPKHCDGCGRRRKVTRLNLPNHHYAYICKDGVCEAKVRLVPPREYGAFGSAMMMDQLLKDMYAPAIMAQFAQKTPLLDAFK